MQHGTKGPGPTPQGVRLSETDRARLFARIARDGEVATARDLQVSRQTLARAAAGLPVQRATAEVLSVRLSASQGPQAA